MRFSEDPEETIQNALAYLKRREWCDDDTWLVVITNALARGQIIDTLQLRKIRQS
jgi:pyruvate kinase